MSEISKLPLEVSRRRVGCPKDVSASNDESALGALGRPYVLAARLITGEDWFMIHRYPEEANMMKGRCPRAQPVMKGNRALSAFLNLVSSLDASVTGDDRVTMRDCTRLH